MKEILAAAAVFVATCMSITSATGAQRPTQEPTSAVGSINVYKDAG